jgi:hypothetical protein
MIGKFTGRDATAIQLAQKKFDSLDPTERYSFQRYLEEAYQHLEARANPGEGPSDPWFE